MVAVELAVENAIASASRQPLTKSRGLTHEPILTRIM
jgi:hypothetical protein